MHPQILFYGWDKPVRELERIVEQYEWLRDDLKKAVAARAQRPWIFTLAHRPAVRVFPFFFFFFFFFILFFT